ncbi:unnamed protein product, partial [Laminaria digitata]
MADRNGRNPHGYGYDNYDDSVGYAASAYAAADAAAARNSARSFYGGPRRAGSLPGSRYPNPSTAYGSYSYPAPCAGGRAFGSTEQEEEEEEGGGRRSLSSDGRRSPPGAPKALSGRVSPREIEVREAAVAAKRARIASANGFSSYSGGGEYGGEPPAPPRYAVRVPDGVPSRRLQSRPAQGIDARYREAEVAQERTDARYREREIAQERTDAARYRERESAQGTTDARYRERGGGRARSYSDQHATLQQQQQQQQQQQYEARPWRRRSSSPRDDYAGTSSFSGASRSGDDSPLAGNPRRGSSGGGRDAPSGNQRRGSGGRDAMSGNHQR